MPFYKNMFHPGEVVLIYFHDEPSFFARVEDVSPDVKKGWWQMKFLVLSMPLQTATWILDDNQMHGANFTMNQNPVRIERVETPEEDEPAPSKEEKSTEKDKPKSQNGGRVVSMFDDVD